MHRYKSLSHYKDWDEFEESFSSFYVATSAVSEELTKRRLGHHLHYLTLTDSERTYAEESVYLLRRLNEWYAYTTSSDKRSLRSIYLLMTKKLTKDIDTGETSNGN